MTQKQRQPLHANTPLHVPCSYTITIMDRFQTIAIVGAGSTIVNGYYQRGAYGFRDGNIHLCLSTYSKSIVLSVLSVLTN